MTIDISKRTSVLVFSIISSNRLVVNKIHSSLVYFYIGSSAWYKLNIDLSFRDILLSGDVETNPGPETLEICSWNLKSIIAHDFLRASLLEAYNSIYNYDLICIVEAHLDSSIDEGRLALNGYTFIKNNHPLNVKRGGVGLYIKNSIPFINRFDLVTLPKCVVSEIRLGSSKYFFVVIYRSPSQEESEFENFMTSFALLLSNLQSEQPFSNVVTRDFNCRSNQWWVNDIENDEGKVFEPFVSELGLHQLISEPTHLMGSSISCIYLILTDQPNLFIKTSVHQSLHEQCHHQIFYGKLSVFNIAPPPYSRRIWFYNKANTTAIIKSLHLFEWEKHLNDIACPNEQVKFLNKTLLNIYSNFIPNRLKMMGLSEAPRMTQAINKFFRKKNRAYKNFIKNGMSDDKSAGMQQMVDNGRRMIQEAKRNYFLKVGMTLANPETSKKTYWSLLNNVLHKARIPNIPPLLNNNSFLTDFTEEAQVFNDYFMLQCSTIDTGSILPNLAPVVSTVLEDAVISEDKILKIIRSLNPSKAHGWDEIFVWMIRLSDDALVIPLKIIFMNCLNQEVFPEIWKYANMVPVYKKE